MIVVYDGSFEAYLSIVYEYYYSKLDIQSIKREFPNTLLVDEITEIEYDEIKSKKVLEALKSKFKKKYFETVLNIFMCDSAEFELDLLNYIVLGFKDQSELENINHEAIFNIRALQKEFFGVYQKMSGFIRFEELEDSTLYAKIDVKFNVLYYLGKHFSKRFNNQKFIIHDLKRELAFLHNESYRGIQKVSSFDAPVFSNDEMKFRKLWQTF